MHVLYDAEVRLTRMCLDVIAMFLRWQVMSGRGTSVCACVPADLIHMSPSCFDKQRLGQKTLFMLKII